MKNILFLVRSVPPFYSNRKDIDDIIFSLIAKGNHVDIYDTKRKLHISVNDKIETDYNFWMKWLFVGKAYLGLNFFVLIYFCLKNQGKYDFVQINYCREEFQLIPQLIKGLGKKLYIFFYGSDLNDRSFVKNNFKKLFYISDKLIATNRSIYKILDKYLEKKRIDDKKTVIFLPQEHFKLYEPLNFSDKVSFKKQLGIPENKIVIMVGNNGTENEQHEKMIDQLQNLKNLENYFFIIPFSNRLDTSGERLKKVTSLAKIKLGERNYKLIPDFVSHEEIAALRMSSDIFLHLRKIDMMAASMFESNMAYCQIITGDWLPYQYYLEKVKVEVISEFHQINLCIEKILSDEKLIEKLNHNRQVVLKDYHYSVIEDWMKLYE
ncbi:hypothetical protein MMU05_03955 [Aquiflexum sp. AIY15W]|nr:hypothetical protein [Cognataquiflexum rubidum]